MNKLDREELILALAVAFKALGDTPEQEDVFGRAQKQLEDLINNQPKVDIELIRKTAKHIVIDIFNKEYNFDNSQTQRAIKEMLKEAGVKIKRK